MVSACGILLKLLLGAVVMLSSSLKQSVLITLATALAVLGALPIPNGLFKLEIIAALANSVDSLKVQADRLIQDFDTQLRKGDPSASIKSAERARQIYHQLGDARRETAALIGIGIAYVANGEIARGVWFLQESLERAHGLGDPEIEALAQQALSFSKSKKNPLILKAEELRQKGVEEHKTKHYPAAIQTWQRALILWRQIGDRRNELQTLGYIAETYDDLNASEEALPYYDQYLSLAAEIGDHKAEAGALTNMSLLYGGLRAT